MKQKQVVCRYGDNVYFGETLAEAYRALLEEFGDDGFAFDSVEFFDATLFEAILQPSVVRKAVRKSRAKK